jgi:hypothetical protein
MMCVGLGQTEATWLNRMATGRTKLRRNCRSAGHFAPAATTGETPAGDPRGLAAAARAAVGDDGHDLIEFFSAVMRGDGKALGSAWLRRTERYT